MRRRPRAAAASCYCVEVSEDRPTDIALFEAWCEGDQRAGERLFTRHYKPVMRYFLNKAPRDYEDLTQRTFMACVCSRDNFRQASSFRSFLFGVARHTLHRWLRERARKHARVDFTEISTADLAPGPSTILAQKREQALILDALRQIPVHFQEVLELHYWERLSGSAIAEIVGISEANVRNRLHRGKAALAKRLEAAGLRAEDRAIEGWATSIDVLRIS